MNDKMPFRLKHIVSGRKLLSEDLVFLRTRASLGRYLLLFIVTCASLVSAQARQQASLALAQFQDHERKGYLEIHYAIPRNELAEARNATNDSLTFALVLELSVYHEQKLWATKIWRLSETLAANAPHARDRDWLDALRYEFEAPGVYRAVLHWRDHNRPGHSDSVEATLQTRAWASGKLQLSDVILATEIRKAGPNSASALNKNGYEIIANPQLIYDAAHPNLFYYFEAYQLHAALRGGFYKSYWHLENEDGRKVEGMVGTFRTKKMPQAGSVEMGSIDVAPLPTGVFTLVYGIADSAKNLLASGRKKFYLYHGEQTATTVRPTSVNLLSALNEKELDDEFNRMQHFTQPEDKKLFLGLNNAEAKREYLMSLWETRRPEEYAAGVNFRQMYLARAKYAEANFPSALRPGWKGDRGRIYILYGPPSHVERETSNANTKPYEIWRYDDLQGGVLFVFADRTGFKNYELVHSTHRNELQNPDWERTISLGTGSDWKR